MYLSYNVSFFLFRGHICPDPLSSWNSLTQLTYLGLSEKRYKRTCMPASMLRHVSENLAVKSRFPIVPYSILGIDPFDKHFA